MYVRAKKTFNYGGIVSMKAGEQKHVKDDIALKLIKKELVTDEVISHKKIKIKSYAKSVDKAADERTEQGD